MDNIKKKFGIKVRQMRLILRLFYDYLLGPDVEFLLLHHRDRAVRRI
jgi:hypothetical protein